MSSSLSDSMERILDRFEDAWNGPVPPCIEEYVALCEPPKRLPLLIELLRIDLERRLTAGEPIRVEDAYLGRFPELNTDPAVVVGLVAREFELRRRREPHLSPAEYFARWPQYRAELAERLRSGPTRLSSGGETFATKPPADHPQKDEETVDVLTLLLPPQMPDELGRLGSYRVLRLLGAGGMGIVFHAEDVQLRRPVALKVMRPTMAAVGTARRRFLREAQVAAALKHDHVVTIYQVGEDRSVPFLAMEFLEGESLHERLQRETTLPLADVLRIGREVAVGLAAAHAHGLVHRDIKPANVWLEKHDGPRPSEPRPSGSGADPHSLPPSEPRPSGSGAAVPRSLRGAARNETPYRVKLLDFGLARPVGGEDTHLTQSGVIVGTPAFMSPEQARGEAVDHRCDLFSLGCVLYRMVTGQLPFNGRDAVSTLLALSQEQPKPPRQLKPEVPPLLNDLIMRLLAKNQADRLSSAGAVVATLQAIEDDEQRPVVPSTVPARQPRHRRRLTPAALALFGMAVLLAAIVLRIRGKDGRDTTIEVPEGSKVTVENDGQVVVVPPDAPAAPLVEGGEPLSPWALVRRPARLKGVRSWTIETHRGRAGFDSLAMRPDGHQLAVSSFDGVIRLYDPNAGRLQKVLLGQQRGNLGHSSLSWSPDGKRLASCYQFGIPHVWDLVAVSSACFILFPVLRVTQWHGRRTANCLRSVQRVR
jgi:serine/threonine protein kinase